jgi:hypothetical protein
LIGSASNQNLYAELQSPEIGLFESRCDAAGERIRCARVLSLRRNTDSAHHVEFDAAQRVKAARSVGNTSEFVIRDSWMLYLPGDGEFLLNREERVTGSIRELW